MSDVVDSIFTPSLDRALRRAADAHRYQTRKGTDAPYIQHPAAVALILARLGYGDTVLAAASLHDVVEDTGVTLDALRAEFGDDVADLIDWCTERKHAADGSTRPWAERKAEQLERLAAAPAEVRAIVLADKLHNLTSIAVDLADGAEVWSRFNAPRADSLRHHREVVTRLMAAGGDARLERLGNECLEILKNLEESG